MGLGKRSTKYPIIVLPNLSENIEELEKKYQRTGYHFGERYKQSKTYSIKCENPIEDAMSFYKTLTKNGYSFIIETGTGKGLRTHFSDGSIAIIRFYTSVPGSPAITIDVSESCSKESIVIKTQKIHFERKHV